MRNTASSRRAALTAFTSPAGLLGLFSRRPAGELRPELGAIVSASDWSEKSTLGGGEIVLATPGPGNWVAVPVR